MASGTIEAKHQSVEISSTTNLNDCIANDTTYYISGAQTPVNAPSTDAKNAQVWNVGAGAYGIQFYASYNSNAVWFRERELSSWRAWKAVTTA